MSSPVPSGSVDLTDCDREPIHQLGLIQPTGFLIAVTADWIVLHASANIGQWLGVEPEDLLGMPLSRVIAMDALHTIRGRLQVAHINGSVERAFGVTLSATVPVCDVAVHLSGSTIVIEAEPSEGEGPQDSGSLLRSMLGRVQNTRGFDAFCREAARQMRALTGFDRVMVYRFDADWNGEVIAEFQVKSEVLFDEVRAGGRIPLIIGRGLTAKARESLGLPASTLFRLPQQPADTGKGYSLAQKMVGRACGLPEGQGVRPGTYCEPKMTSVGSQDTTGPMTRDELKDLACLGFSADLVMQSFCHTAAYPKPVDVKTHHTLPEFISTRGGISLRPGDGVIHSWLNRMLLPDTVGTGGDSHTRFPVGISFPAGSGLVAFAAATGVMPLDMPESVLVRFKGQMQPGVTLRDLVNAIPYYAIKNGLLTVAKAGKKNIFSGRILEIEGLPQLKVEQAFELSDASAERSAAGCTVRLDKEPIIEYLTSNITLLKWMIAEGYQDVRSLARRIARMEEWLANPQLLEPDADAEYAAVIEIDLAEIVEPIVACPNDPDDVKSLSAVAGTAIDEVFIGSCMTNIGHFRAAAKLLEGKRDIPTRLWVAPPTKMDASELTKEGVYGTFGTAGARMEMPGCSLCMGNQAQVREGATVFSTSTRNFPNRLGRNTNVFLGSAELAAICSRLGRIPTREEYLADIGVINEKGAEIYRYMNFDQIEEYRKTAESVAA